MNLERWVRCSRITFTTCVSLIRRSNLNSVALSTIPKRVLDKTAAHLRTGSPGGHGDPLATGMSWVLPAPLPSWALPLPAWPEEAPCHPAHPGFAPAGGRWRAGPFSWRARSGPSTSTSTHIPWDRTESHVHPSSGRHAGEASVYSGWPCASGRALVTKARRGESTSGRASDLGHMRAVFPPPEVTVEY